MKKIMKTTMTSEYESVRNTFGVTVKVGCMSCQHRNVILGVRFCCLTGQQVSGNSICDQWQLSDGLQNAGLGTGVVRRRGTKEIIL